MAGLDGTFEDTKMIDPKRKYRTRDGREVRIYATDGGGDHPVHAAIKNTDGWKGFQFQADGTWCEFETSSDLIEVKPRIQREVWANVYPDVAECLYYTTKKRADEGAVPSRIACVKLTIDCEKGTGLD